MARDNKKNSSIIDKNTVANRLEFLPVCREDMQARGIEELDILLLGEVWTPCI